MILRLLGFNPFLSQNCGRAEVDRHFWRPSYPTALLKQGQPEQVAQGPVQFRFEYVHECRLHYLSGQSLQVFVHRQFRGNLMCFNLCPLPLVVSLALLGSLTLSSSFPTTKCIYTCIIILLRILCSRLNT